MSGQLPSNLTPEQGWAAMREILDREMPVRRRRRAGLWIWPLTMAAGLALALWFRTTGEPVSQPAPETIAAEATPQGDRPSASVPTPGESSDEAANAPAEGNRDQAAGQGQADSETHMMPRVSIHSSRKSKVATSASRPDAASQGVSLQVAEAAIIESPSGTYTDGLATDPHGPLAGQTVKTGDNADEVIAIESPVRTIEVTGPVPTMNSDRVEYERKAPSMDDIPFGHKRPAHPITPYVSLAGLAGTSQGMGTAVAAGAGVRLNRWLSATTGVGYQWMDVQRSFLGGLAAERDFSNAGSPLTEMDFSGNTGGGTVIPEGNLANAVESSDLMPLIDQVNQWQWHVGLEGHLGPRWKLEAGYTLGWGTRVTTQYPIVDAAGTPLENQDSNGNTLNDYGLVKSRSSLLYGGMAYAPLRGLEIFGRYAHDLGHYLDISAPQALAMGSTQGNDRLSNVQVGVRAVLRP